MDGKGMGSDQLSHLEESGDGSSIKKPSDAKYVRLVTIS